MRTLLGVQRCQGERCQLLLAPEREGEPDTHLAYGLIHDIWRVHWRARQEQLHQADYATQYLASLRPPRATTSVLADGNCALRCWGAVVGKPHNEVRAQLADHLAAHPDDLDLCFHGGAAGAASSAATYLDLLRSDRSFVGSSELTILSRLSGRTVVIFSARRATPLVIASQNAGPHLPTVEMLHCGVDSSGEGNHFDLIRARRPDEVAPPLQALRRPPQAHSAVASQGLQAELAAARHVKNKATVLQRIRNERERQGVIRFEAAQGNLVASFLTHYRRPVFPCPVTSLSHKAFCSALRLRLGLSPLSLSTPGLPTSCLCGSSFDSVAASHLLSCANLAKARGDTVVRRHDLVRDVLAWAFRRAGLSVQVEPVLSNETKDRADIIVFDLNNKGYLIDVTIHDATRKSQRSNLDVFLAYQEGVKNAHYGPFAKQRKLTLAPAVFDVGGSPSKHATKLATLADLTLNEPNLANMEGGRSGFLAVLAWALSAAIALSNHTICENSIAALRSSGLPGNPAIIDIAEDDDGAGGGAEDGGGWHDAGEGGPAAARGSVSNAGAALANPGPGSSNDAAVESASVGGTRLEGSNNPATADLTDHLPAPADLQLCNSEDDDMLCAVWHSDLGGGGLAPSSLFVLERSLAAEQLGKTSDNAGGKTESTALLTGRFSFPAGVLDGQSTRARCSWDAARAVPVTASLAPSSTWSELVNPESGSLVW